MDDQWFKDEVKRTEKIVADKARKHVEHYGARAVGKEFKVRLSLDSYVTGTITKVEFNKTTWSGRTCKALFKVFMECGQSKTLRTVVVERFPG